MAKSIRSKRRRYFRAIKRVKTAEKEKKLLENAVQNMKKSILDQNDVNMQYKNNDDIIANDRESKMDVANEDAGQKLSNAAKKKLKASNKLKRLGIKKKGKKKVFVW